MLRFTAAGGPCGNSPSRGAWLSALALSLVLLLPASGCELLTSRPPNIILVLVDTLRADYVGFHGFDGPITPNLDRLATESVVYTNCFVQSPWTKPSVATLFTSLYPQVHRLTNHEGKYWGGDAPELRTGILSPQAETLAEKLREAGYRTAGFVSNPWVISDYGFAQGFDVYDESAASTWADADTLIGAAREWIAGLASDQPFFLYLHFMDVHAPYDARKEDYDALVTSLALGRNRRLTDLQVPYRRWQNIERRPAWASDEQRHELTYWRARYASGVRAFDRRLQELVSFLDERALLDRSYLVVTSDHGEELFEHGDWSHGQNLYDHQLHIPLLIRKPEARDAGQYVDEIVQLIDLMPTLLGFAGVTPPPGVQGRDFASPTGDEEDGVSFATATQRKPGLYSLRTKRFKLLYNIDSGRAWLFDLLADPGERRDLAARRPGVVDELRDLLGLHIAESVADGTLELEAAEVPEDLRERLKSLGYVN
jgi:arylsulfatase A-like enzyme